MSARYRILIQFIAYRLTGLPGFTPLLRGFYGLVVYYVAARIRRNPAVISLYLRRGCAKGEDLPGISDIDLGVLIHDDAAAAAQLERAYLSMRRFFPLLDPCLEIYPESLMTEIYHHSLGLQFRLEEGRDSFQRLAGPPIIEALPPLPPSVRLDTLRGEINVWWGTLASVYLASAEENRSVKPHEMLATSVTCLKGVSETLRVRALLETGTLPPTRRAGLLWAEGAAESPGRELAREVRLLLDRRFTRPAADLPERTLDFLQGEVVSIYRHIEQSPLPAPRQVRQSVDDDPAERPAPPCLEGWTVRQSVFWPVEQPLYVLSGSEFPASPREVIAGAYAALGRDAALFFRHENVLFQVGGDFSGGFKGYGGGRTLHWLVNPDTFAAEFPLNEARWTERLESSFVHWRTQRNWRMEDALTSGDFGIVPPDEWATAYVKAVQLESLRRGALRGEMTYPMTVPAVGRAAQREGISVPDSIHSLFSCDPHERMMAEEHIRANPELLRL